jgi:hypothetical protein
MSASDSEPRAGRIRLVAAQPGVEFVVRDSGLGTVAAGTNRLELAVEPGLYQIERRAGDAVRTDVVLVPAGGIHDEDAVRLPLPTVAPVSASRDARPEYRTAVEAASADVTGAGAGAAALVVAMCQDAPLDEHQHHRDVELLDEWMRPVPAWGDGWRLAEPGVAAWSAALPPGGYLLRVRAGDSVDLPLYLPAGWQTVVFCLHGDRRDRKRMSVHLTPMDVPWRADSPSHTAAETALAALRRGRPVFSADVLDQWLGTAGPVDPMVGIFTAHALRIAGSETHTPDADVSAARAPGGVVQRGNGEVDDDYDVVVARLRELLPGHPDVTALAMRRGGRIEPGELSVSWPPMLLPSYRDLVLPAELVRPSAIADGSTAERIAGRVIPHGPWLAWWTLPVVEVRGLGGRPEDAPVDEATYERVSRFLDRVAGFEGTTAADVRSRWSAADIARACELPARAVGAVLAEL